MEDYKETVFSEHSKETVLMNSNAPISNTHNHHHHQQQKQNRNQQGLVICISEHQWSQLPNRITE